MKKFALVLTLFSVLCLATAAMAGGWNLAALKAEAAKAVPGGSDLGSGVNEDGAFVGLKKGDWNYQFTLSADQEPQMLDAVPVTCKHRSAFFFEPGIPGSGGLMILLDGEKSLTILCMPGVVSDAEISADDMTALAERMDLGAL